MDDIFYNSKVIFFCRIDLIQFVSVEYRKLRKIWVGLEDKENISIYEIIIMNFGYVL